MYYHLFSVKEKHRLHHCGTKVSLKMLISDGLHSGDGSTGQLLIAYWHDLENNVAFHVHVKSFKSRTLGIMKLLDAVVFQRADCSLKQERYVQHLTPRQKPAECTDAGVQPSSLATVGGDVMWNAREFFFFAKRRWQRS